MHFTHENIAEITTSFLGAITRSFLFTYSRLLLLLLLQLQPLIDAGNRPRRHHLYSSKCRLAADGGDQLNDRRQASSLYTLVVENELMEWNGM